MVFTFIIQNNRNAMKILSYVLVVLVIAGSVLYYGCDDSGQLPVELLAGQVVLTQNVHLPTLDPTTDGYYNLFVILADTLGNVRSSHLARFNVLTSGEIVDVSGRIIYTQKGVQASTAIIDQITASNQMLIVRITTKENGTSSHKIVF